MRFVRVSVLLFVSVFAVLTPSPSVQAQPSDGAPCLFYAYTHDVSLSHSSLIGNNSTMFGTSVFIRTDCPGTFDVWVDGMHYGMTGPNYGVFEVPIHTSEITFDGEGGNYTYHGLRFYPVGDFVAYQEYQEARAAELAGQDLGAGFDLASHEFYVAAVTVGLVWFISLQLVERISNLRHAKGFVEEEL